MKKGWWMLIMLVLLVGGLAVWQAVRPEATVKVIRPSRGPIRESVEEQAVTELPRDYLVAMPIDGRLEPIELREGDPVKKGQEVARLDTADLEDRIRQIGGGEFELEVMIAKKKDHQLEENALIEANATVQAIDETVKAAEAKLEASKAVVDFAESELARLRGLKEQAAAADREMREAETEHRKARSQYQSYVLEVAALKTLAAVSYIGPKFITDYTAQKSYDVRSYEQQRDQRVADLQIAKRNLSRAGITSPIDGVVLERHQTQRQFLGAGTPLLTLGRLEDMEVIAEVLTERATQISVGDPVEIFGESVGDRPMTGKVLRVYPAGFKKISSLGVEQQRVKVAVSIEERPESLGVAFRVHVRIYYREAADAVLLPRTALFRGEQGEWQVMIVQDGVTRLRAVQVGLMTDERVQIAGGVAEQDLVVAHPSREITEGMLVETTE